MGKDFTGGIIFRSIFFSLARFTSLNLGANLTEDWEKKKRRRQRRGGRRRKKEEDEDDAQEGKEEKLQTQVLLSISEPMEEYTLPQTARLPSPTTRDPRLNRGFVNSIAEIPALTSRCARARARRLISQKRPLSRIITAHNRRL